MNRRFYTVHEHIWWGHYSGRIGKLIELHWEKRIGKKSPYSLEKKQRREVFEDVIRAVSKYLIGFYSAYGEYRAKSAFGPQIVFFMKSGFKSTT